MTFSNLAVDSVFESPTNPRKTYTGIEELAESIRTYGVLQPILVRPVDDRYECVFGHRRLRAVRAANLDTIPATVRELSDREVLEAQLVENLHRQDIHPLEEGAAYLDLHEKLGLGVDEIAAKVGKSKATVYARMKLCSLSEAGRKAVLEGTLDASLGLLVARIPDQKLQTKALRELLGWAGEGEMPSYRRAAGFIQQKFMLRLAEAPFDPKDETLTFAGACTSCPHRTGAQPELFADVGSAELCTDPACFTLKRDAVWGRLTAEAKDKGQKVLSAKQCKDVFKYSSTAPSYESGYEDLDKTFYDGSKEKTYRQVLKKAGAELEETLARDDHGGIHHLVDKKAVEAILRKQRKEREPATPKASWSVDADWKQRHERAIAESEWRHVVHAKALAKILETVERKGLTDAYWTVLFESQLVGELTTAAERLGLGDKSYAVQEKGVREAFAKAKGHARAALILELALGDILWDPKRLDVAVKAFGVDLKKLEAEAKAEARAKRDAELAEKKAKAKKGKKA